MEKETGTAKSQYLFLELINEEKTGDPTLACLYLRRNRILEIFSDTVHTTLVIRNALKLRVMDGWHG